jgi:FtsZ-interacting cell division protein ZipA
MDTGAIIAIVVGGLALLALLVLVGRKSHEKRRESRRAEAHEVRREAQVYSARAEREQAEADARAARARREEALAQEKALGAEKRGRFAREQRERADELDPDIKKPTGR